MKVKQLNLYLIRLQRYALCMLLWCGCTQMAYAATNLGFELYEVKKGESIDQLVDRYLQGAGALAALIHINGWISPDQVTAGATVKLPRSHLKFERSSARVSHLNCSNAVRIDTQKTTPLQKGDFLTEGAVVRIPAGCQMVLTLEDESNLRMVSGALIRINTLRRQILQSALSVQMELLDGRVSVGVARRPPNAKEMFEVRTPTSVAGVRGTEFRMTFDAKSKESAIEVLTGAVRVRADSETEDRQLKAQQGLVISPEGKSLPVETLLAPPRYLPDVQQRAPSGQVYFEINPKARHYTLVTADDVLFLDRIKEYGPRATPRLDITSTSSRATFVRWASVSDSGLMGGFSDFGICQGEKLQGQWRCDVAFSLSGALQPYLRLERMTESGAWQVLLDSAVSVGKQQSLLFRNLAAGRYRWRLDRQTSTSRTLSSEGAFQLLALRSPE